MNNHLNGGINNDIIPRINPRDARTPPALLAEFGVFEVGAVGDLFAFGLREVYVYT